jgi:hypothetical protein
VSSGAPIKTRITVDPPGWLAVHREIRSNARVRAVFDFLATAVAPAL